MNRIVTSIKVATVAMVLALFTLTGCRGGADGGSAESPGLSAEDKEQFRSLGDSITGLAQKALLANVAGAIQSGGTAYAVAFCHTRAVPLTDSMAKAYEVTISRLTDRNRNPANTLDTELDHQAWDAFGAGETGFVGENPDGAVYYYKAIFMAMPACLQCHGGESDISLDTRAVLAENYPEDKAVGYQAGDLRGMWKVGFPAD